MKLTIAQPLFFAHLQAALLFSNSLFCSLMCFRPVFVSDTLLFFYAVKRVGWTKGGVYNDYQATGSFSQNHSTRSFTFCLVFCLRDHLSPRRQQEVLQRFIRPTKPIPNSYAISKKKNPAGFQFKLWWMKFRKWSVSLASQLIFSIYSLFFLSDLTVFKISQKLKILNSRQLVSTNQQNRPRLIFLIKKKTTD
jgi:hypothetical protein